MVNISVLKLSTDKLDCCIEKNDFIVRHQDEYLAIINTDKISERQLFEELKKEEILSYSDVLAFCAGGLQEPVLLHTEDILDCFPLQIAALIFRRDLVSSSGSYNSKLKALTDFEMLCRLTQASGSCLFVFPGMEEEALSVTERDLFTYAYLIRRYLYDLHSWGKTEVILNCMYQAADNSGLLSVLQKYLNDFLTSESFYERIASVTAPFVIFRGGATCHGVLRDFADALADSLCMEGQAVMRVDAGDTDYEYILRHVCKAVVGFQSAALQTDFVRKLHGPKMQFWLDNPIFYAQQFSGFSEDCYILCQDANYAEFIKEQYHLKNALQFPPGGHICSWPGQTERPYDIIFIGGYIPEENESLEGIYKDYYEYMVEHPDMTFSQGFSELLKAGDGTESRNTIFEYLPDLKSVCQRVINHYRKRVIETILEAGFEIHVYGDSWNAYRSPNSHRLIRHPEVSVEESLAEWQKAKIGLNIMSWHKAGMTERVANIMLSGAVCLSDETEYLKAHFIEGEQIVCYSLKHLEELPHKIKELLEDEKRIRIAYEGYEAANAGHTWRHRAVRLIKMTEDIWNNSQVCDYR